MANMTAGKLSISISIFKLNLTLKKTESKRYEFKEVYFVFKDFLETLRFVDNVKTFLRL